LEERKLDGVHPGIGGGGEKRAKKEKKVVYSMNLPLGN
jgi:hypothetical protein